MFIQRDDYHHCFKNGLEAIQYQPGSSLYEGGERHCLLPLLLPSFRLSNGPKFAKWRARVGDEEANRVTKQANYSWY